MKRCVTKKGLSPVIASVLLILLVLILAVMIFLWASGFFGEQVEKFGKPIEVLCESVDLKIEIIPGTGGGLDALEATNYGPINIKALAIRKTLGGDSEIENLPYVILAGESIREDVEFYMDDGDAPEKIEIVPLLAGNIVGKEDTQMFSCDDNGKVIVL